MENTYWTTLADNNLNNVDIFIACTEKLTFSDTKPFDSGHPNPPPPSPSHKATGRQSNMSQKAGWYTDQELNRLFDPDFKVPKDRPKTPRKHSGKPTPGKPSKPGLQVQSYTIRKHISSKRDFKCPTSRSCKGTYLSQANMNIHVKTTHPDLRWKCNYCTAKYNAAYKHERAHSGPKHECKSCHKKFIYKSHLEEHRRLHTGKGLIPCIGKGFK